MRVFSTKLLTGILLISACISSGSFAQQTESWKYERKITFPVADSVAANPYLCSLDSKGRLYVISSVVTNLNAHNAIYYADPTDTEFKVLVDYTAKNDTINVNQLIGITTIDDDVLVTTKAHKSVNAGGVSRGYYITDGDTAKSQLIGFGAGAFSGWGTLVYGWASTKDSILFSGLAFGGTSVRAYNFSHNFTGAGWGSFIAMDGLTPAEPGGPQIVPGFDIIRDCAANPVADYSKPETKWYTSRNAGDNQAANGGIAVWTGGTQTSPKTYVGQRVSDAVKDLEFGPSLPYGITVDKLGRLWVAGLDTLRRWVKCFEVDDMNFASEVLELPNQNSLSAPDPNGAAFTYPCDVAVDKDLTKAFVVDAGTRAAYVFTNGTSDVADGKNIPVEFALEQNYPNPFNPSTTISYSLPKGMNVRLTVTNSLGQVISTLEDGFKSAGKHIVSFNASNLASGIYFYSLRAENLNISRKMLLMK